MLIALVAVQCVFSQSLFQIRDVTGPGRQHPYNVLHYRIELSFDEPRKTILGKEIATLVPLAAPLKTVEFDAEDIFFNHIRLGRHELRFDSLATSIRVHLDREYSRQETLKIVFDYISTPKKGAYFVQPDSGYPHKPDQIWSQGEDMDNHHWFPCYDFPDDKATSEVILTVKLGQVAVSNGKLLGVKENAKEGTRIFHWTMVKPHSSYLVMFAVGDYAILSDTSGHVPLEYYVYKNEIDDARKCFEETPKIMAFFNARIGFPFPWEKYSQVCIADFMFGGMENTTATTLADYAAVCDSRARLDNSPVSLIAHELAHQWWGDVVTCRDWRHIWLNEGFASYFDPLYFEYSRGRDEFDLMIYRDQERAIDVDKNRSRKPIVSAGSYGENVYARGAAVLHMLRFTLGDSLFWRGIKHYITQHQFAPVETSDLQNSFEETSGRKLSWFFDEWLYNAGHPIFDVQYAWSESLKTISLSISQTQTLDSLTGIFRTPVDIEIIGRTSALTHRIVIASRDTTVLLPCAYEPTLVIFDKGNWILKELNFTKSKEEWAFQAERSANPVDRIQAIRHFVAVHDSSAIPLLAKIAVTDNCGGVKVEAMNSIASFPPKDEIFRLPMKSALLAEAENSSSKVRTTAITQLKNFEGNDVVAALRSALRDSSYYVVAAAIQSLEKVNPKKALNDIKAYVDTPSYRNVVANAALNALTTLDPDRAVDDALQKVRYGENVSGRRTALSVLMKFGGKRKEVLAAYEALTTDKNPDLRMTAVVALASARNSQLPMTSRALRLVSFMGLLSIAFLVIVYLFFRARRKRPSRQMEEEVAEPKKDTLP